MADDSKIVKTYERQALADLAERNPALRPDIVPLMEELTATGSPAMHRKLLASLSQID